MATLFDVTIPTINEHLKKIYEHGEINREATLRKFRIVQKEGQRDVTRDLDFFNLDAIISVGYRVNSVRATQFRQWATHVLREFAIKGYVLDKERMENGAFLGEDYFERLLAEIREIRLSERKFYQKITDIYATSVDYNRDAPTTKVFFAKVQNKLHFAIHEITGFWPLSVSSDRIAIPALRCRGLLTGMGVTDYSGDDRVFEVYPAAALWRWGLPYRGYKRKKGRKTLGMH